MRHDPSAPTVVLSPHLDDAVLSACGALAGAFVVNVFAAVPPPGPPTDALRLTGASDPVAQMRRRLDEDREALAVAGATAAALDLLEADARTEALDAAAVTTAIADVVPAARAVLAPLAIGRHPDHVLVRDAAFALGVPVWLYADLPYAITWGWPAWVTGEAPDPDLDPEVPWRRALDRLPAPPGAPEVDRLDGERLERKRRAVACYASQLPMLAGGPHRRLDDWALRYEVRWPIASP